MIACLKYDVDAMHKYHKTALRLDPHNVVAQANYGSSLAHVGLITEAMEMYHLASESAPGDLNILDAWLSVLLNAGRYRDACALLDARNRLSPDRPWAHAQQTYNQKIRGVGYMIRQLHGVRIKADYRLNENFDENEGAEAVSQATRIFDRAREIDGTIAKTKP